VSPIPGILSMLVHNIKCPIVNYGCPCISHHKTEEGSEWCLSWEVSAGYYQSHLISVHVVLLELLVTVQSTPYCCTL
jgi:hypothetical protein